MHSEHIKNAKGQHAGINTEEAFRDDEIICLICGRGKMKTLARHLNFIHNLKPRDYRKRFGLKGKEPLTARNYGQMRRDFVQQKNSAAFLPKARAAKAAKVSGPDTSSPNEITCAKRAYRRRNFSAHPGTIGSPLEEL